MKKLIILIVLLSTFSCKSIEDIKLQSRLLDIKATVVEVNAKKGYITLFWDCANRPYKNQPCFGTSEHPIYLFDDVHLGDTIQLMKKGI